MSNQAVFDEQTSKQLETLYRIGDVVRRRGASDQRIFPTFDH
jgi:hypothetical protein